MSLQQRSGDTAGLILLSIAIQVPLALFLGHAYDLPIFLATGYLAGTGQNPYVARDLSSVFHSDLFAGLTSIGYPPPWPLVLGGMYRLSFAVVPSLALYRLAIKAPVIAANVLLALLVGRLCTSAGAGHRESRRAMTFFLFNPFLLSVSAAWGQFDTVVALVAMIGLCLLARGKLVLSAVTLGLAVSLKPTALALLPVAAVFAGKGPASARGTLGFAAVSAAALGLFSVAPFALLGWSPQVILKGWNAHFFPAGGLSWLTFMELAAGSAVLPPGLRFLGYLWLPALAAGLFLLRPQRKELVDLLACGLRLTLLLFLTRAWLSEPNVALLLPMAAVLAAVGKLDRRVLRGLWVVPFAFTLFNASLPQVLAPAWPAAMHLMEALDEKAYAARLALRCAAVIPWLAVGWKVVLAPGEASAGAQRESAAARLVRSFMGGSHEHRGR